MITTDKITTMLRDGMEMTFEADIYKGQKLDTKVFLNGSYLCTIAGNTSLAFMTELNKVIEKYKI